MLYRDVVDIWDHIYKPEQFQESTPNDFFEFEYQCLPHMEFQEDQFNEQIKALKAKFDITSPNSFYP